MAKKNISWKTKGMNRDMSASAFKPEFAFENVNIRLATNDGNTMMSWVNERGTKKLTLHIDTEPWSSDEFNGRYEDNIAGIPLGTAIIDHKLVVFSTKASAPACDNIYVFELSKDDNYNLTGKRLYSGDLGFNVNYPIETLVSHESEDIQKVYWTDNKNQPRVINVSPSRDVYARKYNDHSFDFVQELALKEEISVSKVFGVGEFPSGVLQYAFTYYNKYGQESSIFHVTPLQYISYADRGGSPEGKIANSFKLKVSNIDANFDYLRIYSLLRTSKDAIPLVKRIQDIDIRDFPRLRKGGETESQYKVTINTKYLLKNYFVIATEYKEEFHAATNHSTLIDSDCPRPKYKENLDFWESLIPQSDEYKDQIEVYKFDRASFPRLEIYMTDSNNAKGNYFTWAKTSLKDAVIYLMYIRANALIVLVGENEDGSRKSAIYCSHEGRAVESDMSVTFIDNGLVGDTVDPTELLYKGGEQVSVKTLEQKDNTLFLGNVSLNTLNLKGLQAELLDINEVTRDSPLIKNYIGTVCSDRQYLKISPYPLPYVNTLSTSDSLPYQGAVGFKGREYYRLGVQFQYKTGKWSEPLWLGDARCEKTPSIHEPSGKARIPEFVYHMNNNTMRGINERLKRAGFKRARPVFVVPKFSDRTILCQGVACPTLYRNVDRYSDNDTSKEGSLYAQSSWLFRCPTKFSAPNYGEASDHAGKVTSEGVLKSQFSDPAHADNQKDEHSVTAVSPWLRNTEVMGNFDDNHSFRVDTKFMTIHSPELVFDESFSSMDFKGCSVLKVGSVDLSNTYGDIDIQTSSAQIGSDSLGFLHRNCVTDGYGALISGLFYEDYLVDDIEYNSTTAYNAYNQSGTAPSIFPVFMWHKNGSLNNDVYRNGSTAELLKKKISNYRVGNQTVIHDKDESDIDYKVADIQLFNSNEESIVKVNGHIYMGNIDSMVTPTSFTPHYFAGSPWRAHPETEIVDFSTEATFRLQLDDSNNVASRKGIAQWKYLSDYGWGYHIINDATIGDRTSGLNQWREGISIKYKSTPHLVAQIGDDAKVDVYGGETTGNLPLVEVVKKYNPTTIFNGTSDEALQAATWIPCGPSVPLDNNMTLNFKWGDTYFQRFECLKTYPFTKEDKNQVVEIASFMVETRVNIDGRYDRNRTQISNLNMSPQNFNLINPVYSQMDNFFSYKMLDKDYYDNTMFPNTITWTKTKQNGADIDLWTNVTLASTLELDGNKGQVHSLNRLNDQLISFQDSGISQVLYNENTQISTTEGVPIEIANSGKVQGKRYLSNTVGCSNKWSIAQTPEGIYFMDSNEKSIYLFNGQLNNLSTAAGMNSWTKQKVPAASVEWSPCDFDKSKAFVSYYDRLNQEVLFITGDTALAYSEKFGCFTSFYDYGGAPYFNSLDDVGIWTTKEGLWQHQAGNYGCFFGKNKPFSMTLIANQEPQVDKMFTNIEFRACIDGEGNYIVNGDKFTPNLPFDTLEAWNEYQHGILRLHNRDKKERFTHGEDNGILLRKFRMWRCDIPRDNAPVEVDSESKMGIKRFKVRPLDRIRNPWAYVKLTKNAASNDSVLSKVEIHDVMATYFG